MPLPKALIILMSSWELHPQTSYGLSLSRKSTTELIKTWVWLNWITLDLRWLTPEYHQCFTRLWHPLDPWVGESFLGIPYGWYPDCVWQRKRRCGIRSWRQHCAYDRVWCAWKRACAIANQEISKFQKPKSQSSCLVEDLKSSDQWLCLLTRQSPSCGSLWRWLSANYQLPQRAVS